MCKPQIVNVISHNVNVTLTHRYSKHVVTQQQDSSSEDDDSYGVCDWSVCHS